MAWQEVEVTLKHSNGAVTGPCARVRTSVNGGLTIALNRLLCAELGWPDNHKLTLLVGGAESDGKIALKPKASGPITLTIFKPVKGASKMGLLRVGGGSMRVGHFGRLSPAKRSADVVLHEIKSGNLVLTLPDGWLSA